MDLYQQYIAKSRYARYLSEQNRREHFSETVDRYVSYMCKHVEENNKVKVDDETKKKMPRRMVKKPPKYDFCLFLS